MRKFYSSALCIFSKQKKGRLQLLDVSGFTLLEMLVVVGIMGVMAVLSIAGFGDFNNRQKVKQAALTLKNNLRFAQTKATAAKKPLGCTRLAGYRVSFPTDTQYTISPVCTPEGVLTADITVELPVSVTFATVPSPFTYGILTTGITDIPSVRVISLRGVNGINFDISVFPNGEVTGESL